VGGWINVDILMSLPPYILSGSAYTQQNSTCDI